eukprot:scaffold501_cov407-Prasinococcus_capsulatus_cf.AAC.10
MIAARCAPRSRRHSSSRQCCVDIYPAGTLPGLLVQTQQPKPAFTGAVSQNVIVQGEAAAALARYPFRAAGPSSCRPCQVVVLGDGDEGDVLLYALQNGGTQPRLHLHPALLHEGDKAPLVGRRSVLGIGDKRARAAGCLVRAWSLQQRAE